MEYKIAHLNYNTPSQELLNDLKLVADKMGADSLTQREYSEMGKFHPSTIYERFGTWNKSLEKAGLTPTLVLNIPTKELFENMERTWISLGRQPSRREMRQPLSKYSTSPYVRKFGSWRKAIYAFVQYVGGSLATDIPEMESKAIIKHKTKREPSERLKVQVLMRDGNKCRICGAIVAGDDIHFDHVLAWSKGGETVLENLQILCARHNLAKGNL